VNSKYKFTIFTSCYDSEKFIHRLYDSLKAQSFTDFEWLIVDDFSNDSTRSILESIEKEAPFDVRIFYNNANQMIASCCNFAVKNALGEFFIFLDHDDELVPQALERFNNIWNNISIDQQSNLAGMMSNCQDQYGNFITDELPEPPCITDFYSMYYELGIKGEKLFCYLTSVMLENNFSTIDRYVPENLVLLNISDKYETYFFNENLRIYHVNQLNHESLSAKLMRGGWQITFPLGMRHAKLEDLNRRSRKMIRDPFLFFSTVIHFWRFSLHAKIGFKESFYDLNSFLLKISFCLTAPFSSLLYFRDRIKLK
jgi:glycosyltransferase involved in cell wall biosynthesis